MTSTTPRSFDHETLQQLEDIERHGSYMFDMIWELEEAFDVIHEQASSKDQAHEAIYGPSLQQLARDIQGMNNHTLVMEAFLYDIMTIIEDLLGQSSERNTSSQVSVEIDIDCVSGARRSAEQDGPATPPRS